jgi:hypothetical protein
MNIVNTITPAGRTPRWRGVARSPDNDCTFWAATAPRCPPASG